MNKRLRIIILVLLAFAVGGLAWYLLHPREPSYQGKTFRVWLYTSRNAAIKGRDDDLRRSEYAIRQIGTNALPILLRMSVAKDSAVKKKTIEFLRKQSFIRIHLQSESESRDLAEFGFKVLGPIAKLTVPRLIALLSDPVLQESVACSLGSIGPVAQEAVPSLVALLDSKDRMVRKAAADSLIRIRPARREEIIGLTRHLADPDSFVRGCVGLVLANHRMDSERVVPVMIEDLESGRLSTPAIQALAAFGGGAKPAVPVLIQLWKEWSPWGNDLGTEASNALQRIDPEAFAKQAASK